MVDYLLGVVDGERAVDAEHAHETGRYLDLFEFSVIQPFAILPVGRRNGIDLAGSKAEAQGIAKTDTIIDDLLPCPGRTVTKDNFVEADELEELVAFRLLQGVVN